MLRSLRKLLRFLFTVAICIALSTAISIAIFVTRCPPMPLQVQPTPAADHAPPQAAGVKNYARTESDAFFSYPEWYIVWSYQAKADYQLSHPPSGFSYFGDAAQFWEAYCRIYALTRNAYPFNTGGHIMLAVIGTSFTAEYAIKGAYEKTIGKLSEWTAHSQLTEEDHYAAQVAERYADFVHIRPFYEFSFLTALRGLWHDVPFRTTHLIRSIERRAWLTLDYAFESAYCEIIELGTHATYGYEDTETAAWIHFDPSARAAILATPHTRIAKDIGPNELILELPRYQEFTPRTLSLITAGAQFHQISGNNLITVSVLAPTAWTNTQPNTQTLITQPVLSQPGTTRTLLLMPVAQLHTTLPAMQQQGVTIEHLYDF